MTYQEIYAAHVAGNPPLAYLQTSVETFAQYKERMNSQGLQPDITASVDGDFESDAAYEARLATYSFPQDASPRPDYVTHAVLSDTESGTVTSALSASYVLGSGVSGAVANAITGVTASYVSASKVAGGVATSRVMFTDTLGAAVTMSFNHGVLVAVA